MGNIAVNRTGIDKRRACMILRVLPSRWIDKGRFDELLCLLDSNRAAADGIMLFTSETHRPLTLDEAAARAVDMKARLDQIKERGYYCGVNILSTMGHVEEDIRDIFPREYRFAADIDGNVCRGSFCPNDPIYLERYVGNLYTLVARMGPEHIWIDDDVRFGGHKPAGTTCFCDVCIDIFSKETGVEFTRETLKAAFDDGETKDKISIRRAWLEHNRKTLDRLFAFIEKTVHQIDSSIKLGFMTGERYFEGYDFDTWARTLAGAEGHEVMWRPGGGFYEDSRLSDMLQKSHEIGRQISLLPPWVDRIYSEIECFFYQKLKKSTKTVVLEIAAYISAGCTGAALNILSENDCLLQEHQDTVKAVSDHRAFYDHITDLFGRSAAHGIWAGWCKDSLVGRDTKNDGWMTGYDMPDHTEGMHEIGLPQAYGYSDSCVSALSGTQPYSLGNGQIMEILSKGLFLDGEALTALNELGYSAYTGFKTAGYIDEDCIEEFTDHSLNGTFSGMKRNCRQSFWRVPAAVFEETAEGTGSLARIIDYEGKVKAGCCLGIFENSLGGRVCAAGYYPWSYMHNMAKSEQIKSIAGWLSKDSLPAYVSSLHKAALWVRKTEKGKWACALMNCSLDPAIRLRLKVSTQDKAARVTGMDMDTVFIEACGTEGAYTVFEIPYIAPWDMSVIEIM